MIKELTIKSLQNTMEQTLGFFDLGEPFLRRTYGEGKWNVREILHHLTDSEVIFVQRLKTVIAEPGKVIWAYDQDLWNKAFSYVNEPLGDKKSLYKVCRMANIRVVDKYFNLDRQFVHSEAGMRTLKDEFTRIASHNQTHLDQIGIALTSVSK